MACVDNQNEKWVLINCVIKCYRALVLAVNGIMPMPQTPSEWTGITSPFFIFFSLYSIQRADFKPYISVEYHSLYSFTLSCWILRGKGRSNLLDIYYLWLNLPAEKLFMYLFYSFKVTIVWDFVFYHERVLLNILLELELAGFFVLFYFIFLGLENFNIHYGRKIFVSKTKLFIMNTNICCW